MKDQTVITALKFLRIAALFALAMLPLSTSFAGANPAPAGVLPAADAPCSAGPTDAAELEAFLDRIIEPLLKDAHIPGVTLSVVRDGKVFLTKGYGYADISRSIPVRPDSTLFRIGSVTKLFTWTAVMQLVEQGRLDLEADVNTYLDFKVPSTYAEPITLKHMMSHTTGFEEIGFGLFPSRLDLIQPLGNRLAARMPARVRPPGQVSAYSNYAVELAGYIVERVSGLPYQEYVEKNLFQPLSMEHSTARQPLPAALASDMSVGYNYAQGAFLPNDFQLLPQPEGAISSTASDMARFMIAHLQNGQYGNGRILGAPTAQQMHSTLFRMDERVNGLAYGFMERDLNGQRVIAHSGDTLIYVSDLWLLPDSNLGLFVSTNARGGVSLVEKLFPSFMNHYFPVEPEVAAPAPADFRSRASNFTGTYRAASGSYTNFEKVNVLLAFADVNVTADGALQIGSPLEKGTVKIVEVQPLLFRDVASGMQVVFREDGTGTVTHLLNVDYPDQTLEKLSWYESPYFHYGLLLFCGVLFLSTLVAPLAGFIMSRLHKGEPGCQLRLLRAARTLLGTIALLNLLALADFTVVFFGNYQVAVLAISNGDLSSLNLPLLLWLLAAILTIGAVLFSFLAWKNRYWSAWARVHYSLVTAAALAFVWFLNSWNLLGWRV